jgi:hypothetical protein
MLSVSLMEAAHGHFIIYAPLCEDNRKFLRRGDWSGMKQSA